MEKRIKILFLFMIVAMIIAIYWDSLPFVKNSMHAILDPTAGNLLNWNISLGMLIISFVISIIISIFQKFTVDQAALRELKKEQKFVSEEIKKYANNPEKLAEFNKKQLEFFSKTWNITAGSLIYTLIPIALFFRWFSEYFTTITNPVKIYGIFSTTGSFLFPSWFWAYLITSIIFSTILRKVLKLA